MAPVSLRKDRCVSCVERKQAPPAARQRDDHPLAAAPAHHHACRFEPPHVIRGAARGGTQDLVELANGPGVPESDEELRPLDAHERVERRTRRIAAAHRGPSSSRPVPFVCGLHTSGSRLA